VAKRTLFVLIRCGNESFFCEPFTRLRALPISALFLLVLLASVLGSCPKSKFNLGKPEPGRPEMSEYLFLCVCGRSLTLLENGERSLPSPESLAFRLPSPTDFDYDEKTGSLFVSDGNSLVLLEPGIEKPIMLEIPGEIGKYFLTSLLVSPSRENAVLVGFDPIDPQADNLVYWASAGNGKATRIPLPEIPTPLSLIDSKFIGEHTALLLYQASDIGKGFVLRITPGEKAKKLLETSGQAEQSGASEVEPVDVKEELSIKPVSVLVAGDSLLLAVSVAEGLDEFPRSELWKFSLEKGEVLEKFELPGPADQAFLDLGFATLGDEVYYARLSEKPSNIETQEAQESEADTEENETEPQLKLAIFRFNLKSGKSERIIEVEPSRFSAQPLYSVQLFPQNRAFILFYEDDKVYQAVPLSFSGAQICPAFKVDKPKVQIIREKPWFFEKPLRQK